MEPGGTDRLRRGGGDRDGHRAAAGNGRLDEFLDASTCAQRDGTSIAPGCGV